MAGSLKDALEKSGITPPAEEPKPGPKGKKQPWREPLPDDETLPPLFDAPALTKPIESKPAVKKK